MKTDIAAIAALQLALCELTDWDGKWRLDPDDKLGIRVKCGCFCHHPVTGFKHSRPPLFCGCGTPLNPDGHGWVASSSIWPYLDALMVALPVHSYVSGSKSLALLQGDIGLDASVIRAAGATFQDVWRDAFVLLAEAILQRKEL